MSKAPYSTNHILERISVAARTALSHPRNVELSHFIGAGPSIRARARLAFIAVFLVVVPIIFVGVMRAENVTEHATALHEYDDYWKQILNTKLALKNLDQALLAYLYEREFENAQRALSESQNFLVEIKKLITQKPRAFEIAPKGFMEGLSMRLDSVINRSIANDASLAPARLSIISLAKELADLENRVILIAVKERKVAVSSLSKVGRDQLVLFLVLLFSIPIFIGFVPGWLVAPLKRLMQISHKVETGQLKELSVSGQDEVAILARSLKSYFLRKEELDHKKSSKIFELRNVLRAVINRVKEPIFIVDKDIRINYTNDAAALQIGLPVHQMEGKSISDCMYSPVAKKAAEKAFGGDVSDEAIPLQIESTDGREFSLQAKVAVVRNREGEVSRAVIVLYKNEPELNT